MRKIGVILIIVSLVSLSMSVYGITTTFNLYNYGSVSQMIVYPNELSVDKITSINWGTLTPDSIQNTTIYIKNTGDKALTLTMTATNWNPSNASDYLSFAWDGDHELAPYAKNPYILYLTVYENVIESTLGNFNFDIIINGTSV